MNADTWIQLGMLLLAIGANFAAIVWTVASIKGRTGELKHAIERLADAVDKLENVIETIRNRQMEHEVRISIIERLTKLGIEQKKE